MKLSELKLNQKAIITKITSNNELKQRFYSFGIVKGAEVYLHATSLAKNTIEIIVEDTAIALRLDEAEQIEVKTI